MKVSIIIPIYKQEKTIKVDLETICTTMSKTRWDYEVIAVVDGSPDDSFKEAKKVKQPNLQVYKYDINKGKGYAVRYGMARATGDYISLKESSGEPSTTAITS